MCSSDIHGKKINSDPTISLKIFVITNDALVVLQIPHLNAHKNIMSSSQTFTENFFKFRSDYFASIF